MADKFKVVGLGNALMDALHLLPNDSILASESLNKGEMAMVADDRWQQVFSTLNEGDVSLQTGGSCANTIATLGLLGAKVSFCSQVGADEFGSLYEQQLLNATGHSHLLHSDSAATGKCLSLISPDAERTLLTDLGASVLLPSVDHFADAIRNSEVLYLTGYLMFGDMRTRMMEAIAIAEDAGCKIALDVADPSVINLMKDDMLQLIRDHIDIVFSNEAEAQSLCGGTPEESLQKLRSMCEVVVVKLGSKGSLACQGDELVRADVHKVSAVDTTGAGDSYAAGFLYGYGQGWPLQQCADIASRVAAQSVAQLGAVVRDQNLLAQQVKAVRG